MKLQDLKDLWADEPKEMHESNEMFQVFVGKTVATVEYVDDYGTGFTLTFTDGSVLNISEAMQAGQISVSAITFNDPEETDK